MLFSPLTFVFMAILLVVLVFLFVLAQINLIVFAFAELGIPGEYIVLALLGTLIGSFVNIPVKKIPQESMAQERSVRFFGFSYVVPFRQKKETLLAVNLGGAVLPVILSSYLLFRTGLWMKGAVAVAVMSVVTHKMARPIRGVGIGLPFFLPPLLAALLSVIIAYGHAPIVAYVSGTLGTLIGADLLNLSKIGKLGAPVASIGGAGTFDGIFLTGILAVLLAALLVP